MCLVCACLFSVYVVCTYVCTYLLVPLQHVVRKGTTPQMSLNARYVCACVCVCVCVCRIKGRVLVRVLCALTHTLWQLI